MSGTNETLRSIAVAAGGGIVGVVVAVLLGTSLRTTEPPKPTKSSDPNTPVPVPSTNSAIGAAATTAESPSPSVPPAATPLPLASSSSVATGNFHPDPAAARADFERRLTNHSLEVRDVAWAKTTEAAFQHDLDALGSGHAFVTTSVDCRNVTCTAVLEWPSFETAVREYESLSKAEYAVNCGVAMALVDKPQPGKAFRTTAVFDCETAKYGEL